MYCGLPKVAADEEKINLPKYLPQYPEARIIEDL